MGSTMKGMPTDIYLNKGCYTYTELFLRSSLSSMSYMKETLAQLRT
jgi:hypothetical protein